MAAFTLAHLSDPHLPPLPAARLRDLAGKRALGYLNWTRNRHKYPPARRARCAGVGYCRRRRPITSRSPAISSISRSRRNSRRRGHGWKASARPTVSPRPGQSRRLCSRDAASLCRELGELSRRRRCARWRRRISFLRRRGPLALIGVSSAVPTAAADGDGMARRIPARCARADAGAPVGRAGVSRAADPSSAAFGFRAPSG